MNVIYHINKMKGKNPMIVSMDAENYLTKFNILLLLLLLSRISHVQLCVTPQTAAHQATLPLGFSRQESWSGLLFPAITYFSLNPSCLWL